jgi:exopolysaccharide production protein ExoY
MGAVVSRSERSGSSSISTGAEFLKRLIDVLGALPLLILCGLMIPILKLLQFVSHDIGSVFFRQTRAGRYGNPIEIIKFRSMRIDAEEILRNDEALYQAYVSNGYKLPPGRDPRITRVGRYLRKLSLDELPQSINILRGEMSLVGPRPLLFSEIEDFIPVEADREKYLSMRPGLTGEWQVNGRSDVIGKERIALELDYVDKWSLKRDLQILMKTPVVVLQANGAH